MLPSTKKSRRHRNPIITDEKRGPFFSKNLDDNESSRVQQPFFQTKLQLSQPNDKYEREADAVADRVISSNLNQNGIPAIGRISAVQHGSLQPAQKKIQCKAELESTSLQMQEMEEEEPVQMMEEEEETMQMQQDEEEVQMQEVEEEVQMQEGKDDEEVQMQEEEEEVQMMEVEEEEVQSKSEQEEEVQMQEEEEEPIQMKEGEKEEESVQMKKEGMTHASGKPLSNRISEKAGRGRSLPGKTKAEMESAFGVDFSKVNIHTDTEAVQMNKGLGAQAFTHGSDVYFNSGKYRPESVAGKKLLAHELTHVVQQGGGSLKIQKKGEENERNVVSEEKDPIADLLHDEKESSEIAPGLTKDVYEEVNKLIGEKKRKEALNILVEFLKRDGQIDGSLLTDGKIFYGGSGEGMASPPGYKEDPDTGEKVARPTTVKLGRVAFKNVAWLYSSLMHEYMHVLQFQEPVAKGTKGQRGLDWLINRQEVEAYSYEILKAEKTGLASQPDLVLENWNRLNGYWKSLGKSSKKLLATMYENTYQKVKSIVTGKNIIYKPYKEK